MAIDLTGNPWVFDATTQTDEALGPVFVESIVAITGTTSGNVTVLSESGGKEIVPTIAMGVNDRQSFRVNGYVEGIYIQDLPTSAKVAVYFR